MFHPALLNQLWVSLLCTPAEAKPNLSQLYLSRHSLAKPAKLNFFKTLASAAARPGRSSFFRGELKAGAFLWPLRRPPWTACEHFCDSYPIDVSHLSFNFLCLLYPSPSPGCQTFRSLPNSFRAIFIRKDFSKYIFARILYSIVKSFIVVRRFSKFGWIPIFNFWSFTYADPSIYYTIICLLFKGTVSWDRFQKCWQKFTELGLSKGRGGF